MGSSIYREGIGYRGIRYNIYICVGIIYIEGQRVIYRGIYSRVLWWVG